MAAAAADRALSGALASTSSAADRVAAFKRRFPCREQQIDLLADELTRRGSAGASSCLVYGPAATGKTAVVRCAAVLLQALCLPLPTCMPSLLTPASPSATHGPAMGTHHRHSPSPCCAPAGAC